MRSAICCVAAVLAVAGAALPRCMIAVAGANGRVGSMVCRHLLRNHEQVTVRALVRSASDPYQGYGKLSYEVGAEDGKMSLAPALQFNENGVMGAATTEFDEEVQGGYGLDRLEIRECELRYARDVEDALADVDAVVYCASAFNSFRQRLPDRVDDAASRIAQAGMNLFELRLGKAFFGDDKEDGSDEPRRKAAQGKTADVEGLENTLNTLAASRRRRASLAQLTGGKSRGGGDMPALVLLSSASSLGYDDAGEGSQAQENEFGFRKRTAEAAVRAAGVPHVIVRSSVIDDVRGQEGLDVQVINEPDESEAEAVRAGVVAGEAEAKGAVGVRAGKEARSRRVHPRDLAAYLVGCLSGLPRSSAARGADVRALDAEIAGRESEKATAIAEQNFLRAGELLEDVKRLKEQRSATLGRAQTSASKESSTVEVWTYVEGKPFLR